MDPEYFKILVLVEIHMRIPTYLNRWIDQIYNAYLYIPIIS